MRLSFLLRADTPMLTPTMTLLRLEDMGGAVLLSLLADQNGGTLTIKMTAPSMFGPVTSPAVGVIGTAKIAVEWRATTSASAADGQVRFLLGASEVYKSDVSQTPMDKAARFDVGAVNVSGAADKVTLVLDGFSATECF